MQLIETKMCKSCVQRDSEINSTCTPKVEFISSNTSWDDSHAQM